MRVLVIGLDGLEHDLVVELGLRRLMQVRYGSLRVPEELYYEDEGIPYTPKVWTALLTGRRPGVGEDMLWVYENRLLERVRRLPIIRWVKGKRAFLKRLGITPRRTLFRIRGETVLDRCRPSLAVNAPGINPWIERNRLLGELMEEGRFRELIKEAFNYAKDVFSDFTERAGNKDYRLMMVYTNLSDIIGHVCWFRCRPELVRAYRYLDFWVPRLVKAAEPDVTLIVSDHGMRGASDGVSGTHSDHLFWSTSINTEPFKTVYDIPTKVVEWCRTDNRS